MIKISMLILTNIDKYDILCRYIEISRGADGGVNSFLIGGEKTCIRNVVPTASWLWMLPTTQCDSGAVLTDLALFACSRGHRADLAEDGTMVHGGMGVGGGNFSSPTGATRAGSRIVVVLGRENLQERFRISAAVWHVALTGWKDRVTSRSPPDHLALSIARMTSNSHQRQPARQPGSPCTERQFWCRATSFVCKICI